MVRNLLVVLFLGMSFCLLAQTSENPFDLKYRPAKRIDVVSPVKPAINPDTLHKELELKDSTGQVPDQSVYEDTSIINLGIQQPDTKLKAIGENPFEIKSNEDSAHAIGNPGVPKGTTQATSPSPAPLVIKNSLKGFQIFFLLLSLLFLIFIVNVERNFVRELWRVISNENYSSLHHRNQRNTMRQILLLMGYAIFIFQSGIFIYHALRVFNYHGDIQLNIWILMLLIVSIYLIRHAVIRYLRWLFNNQKEMTLFGFDISIFNTMVGLILLPINILLLFGPETIYKPLVIIGIIAIISAYLVRQLRWILTARGLIAHSLFLFFIYLCTVEILPLWALSKFFW